MSIASGLSKYSWGSAEEADQGHGHLVGRRPSDHLPVRGGGGPGVPDMRGDEADELPVACDFRAGMFRMWVPEENAAYVKVMDRIYNGAYSVLVRREILAGEPETGLPGEQMKIWLEWAQVYAQAPSTDPHPGGRR